MSLLTALMTATVFAAFGFPYRYYQCWYSWGGARSYAAGLVYFVLAGGGGGLLGWLLALLAQAHPTDNLAVNGFLYGAGGALTLRADFRPRRALPDPTARPAGPDPSDDLGPNARSAASVLAIGLSWTGGALDDISERHIEAWLKSQDDNTLLASATDVFAKIRHDPDTPDRAKKATLNLLVRAMEQVGSTDRNERLQGRAHVITFCAAYYLQEHIPRPLTTDRAADPGISLTG
jgi:hypothetical protein